MELVEAEPTAGECFLQPKRKMKACAMGRMRLSRSPRLAEGARMMTTLSKYPALNGIDIQRYGCRLQAREAVRG